MRVKLNYRRLRGELARSRLSQNHWARRLGLDKGHLSQLVNGKRPYPSAPTRTKLLEGLGLRFEDLFSIEEGSSLQTASETSGVSRPTSDLGRYGRRALPVNEFPRARGKGINSMKGFPGDLKLAWRMVFKAPLFSALTIGLLALGLGANLAIFSVFKAVVLNPLPYPQSEQLVLVWENDRHRGTQREGASVPDFLDLRERAKSFAQLAAFQTVNRTLTGEGEPRRLVASRVTVNFLPTLGVQPVYGRHFSEEEATEGQHRVVLLHQSLWQSAFGRDPGVLGRQIFLDGEAHTIIGIVPAEARLPGGSEQLWIPMAIGEDDLIRGRHSILVVGRMLPGLSLEQAQQEMTAIMAALEKEYPEDNAARGAFVASLHSELVGEVRPALLLLMAAVGCLLLTVCANVANLLLSRGTSRYGEMAVRMALGASRGHIVRQMMTESLLLTLIGLGLALGLAAVGTRFLLALSPPDLPRFDQAGLDGPLTLFALMLSLATWLVFGLLPALRVSDPDLQQSLREGGRGASEAAGRQRLKKVLVVAEVAVAVVLVISAGLLLRSFRSLSQVDPGLQTRHVLSLNLELPASKYPAPEDWPFLKWPQVSQLQSRLLQEVESLPGVRSASLALSDPLSGAWTTRTRVVGKPVVQQEGFDEAYFQPVSENYFQTCGIPLKKGRFFTPQDDESHPLVTIVNQAFVDFYFGDEDPLGQRIIVYGPEREIVGVVGNVRFRGLARGSYPAMYLPFRQNPMGMFSLVYRADPDPARLLPAVKSVIWRIDSDLAMFNISVLDEALSTSLSRERFTLTLLLSFALSALLLAAIGIYGVITYLVAQRTHEIGIRMALGASRREVFQLIVGAGMMLAAMGVGIGLIAGWGSSRLLSGLLFGISRHDPWTFGAVPFLLVLVAFLACYLPARRACRIDPMSALRYQ